jgi:hypothetical protein
MSSARRRNPLRCQRRKVLGLTFTRASRQENMRPRMTIVSRVESWARCGLTLRSWNKASCLRRKRFSAASARRDRETSTGRRTRSHATKDSVLRPCVSNWKREPGMNAQRYTLRDVMRLPTGGRPKFVWSPAGVISLRSGMTDNFSCTILSPEELQ